jgi:hypothetical protein
MEVMCMVVEREDLALTERGWVMVRVPDGWQIWVWQTGVHGCTGKWVTYDEPYRDVEMASWVANTELGGDAI